MIITVRADGWVADDSATPVVGLPLRQDGKDVGRVTRVYELAGHTMIDIEISDEAYAKGLIVKGTDFSMGFSMGSVTGRSR